MTALAANASVVTKNMQNDDGIYLDLVVKSGSTVYQGSLVSIDSGTGHIRPFVQSSGDAFVGMALAKLVGDGVKTVQVLIEGLIECTMTSAAATDIGAKVYAIDDSTLVTKTSTNNVFIGTIAKYLGASLNILVRMRPWSTTS